MCSIQIALSDSLTKVPGWMRDARNRSFVAQRKSRIWTAEISLWRIRAASNQTRSSRIKSRAKWSALQRFSYNVHRKAGFWETHFECVMFVVASFNICVFRMFRKSSTHCIELYSVSLYSSRSFGQPGVDLGATREQSQCWANIAGTRGPSWM